MFLKCKKLGLLMHKFLNFICLPLFITGTIFLSNGLISYGKLYYMDNQQNHNTSNQMVLQKTMVMSEGVARNLNPHANMWELSRPLAEEWMRQHSHPAAVLERTFHETRRLILRLPVLLDQLEKQSEPVAKQPSFGMFTTSLLSVTAIVISLAVLLR